MRKNLSSGNAQQLYSPLYSVGVVKDRSGKQLNNIAKSLQPGYSSLLRTGKLTTGFFQQPLDKSVNRFIKRAFDISISSAVIVLILSWLIPLFAIAIMIDSAGPVFFFQKRNKKNGDVFTCIKFRSMIVNDEADISPAVKNDERITKVGRFLRDHYMDELPQFFNVLLGEMSVIGPRPHMISENIKYDAMVEHYAYRHSIKPGITGLAQVLGFAGIATEKHQVQARLNMDIFYIRRWSFKMDLIILYRSFLKIFTR
ncbi:MAG: hypothetical protein JWP81_1266 [Ferruginibacter sp.]|nr:hypothetical protein [Ferruginibacter sp.]